MSRVQGFLWKETDTPPTFTRKWVKSSMSWSLRDFPMTNLSYRLPIEYRGGVSQKEVDRLGLKPGDHIIRGSGFCSMPIQTVNGIPVPEWTKRWPGGTPEWPDLPNKPNRFVQFSRGDPMTSLLSMLFPQREGTMVLVAGGRASRKSDVTKNILWSLDPNRYKIMYVFLERSDEIPVTAEGGTTEQKTTLPPYAELWSFPFELQRVEEELVGFVNLVKEISEQRVLAGQNIVVLIDSLEVFAKALNTATPANGAGFMSGGLIRPAVTALRTWISAAKKPPIEGVGSLTIMGLYRTNPKDTGTSSLFTEIQGVSQGHIIMRDEDVIPCSAFPVNVKTSLARMIEAIRGREGAQKVWDLVSAVRGREDQIYLNAVGGDRLNTPEQRAAALKRAGIQLDVFYHQLMSNCTRMISPEDSWDHWQGVLDGSYPPPTPEFDPIQPTQQAKIDADAKRTTEILMATRPAQPVEVKEPDAKDLTTAAGITIGDKTGRRAERVKATRNELFSIP